jgi:hypothetical protein
MKTLSVIFGGPEAMISINKKETIEQKKDYDSEN